MPFDDVVPVRRKVTGRAHATEQRRRQILRAAEAAFAANGYDAASLRDIAARAGTSHQALLYHYPEKAALLEAVLDQNVGSSADEFDLERSEGVAFFRGLVALAVRDAANPVRLRMFYRLESDATAPDNPAHGYYRRWYSDVRTRFVSELDHAAGAGRYRSDVPFARAALHLCGFREGLALQFLLDPTIDYAAEVEGHLQVYVDLSPDDAGPDPAG
ncbi:MULTISPECIES: TetR family transcriptional regulator [Curtobacterium]|uniref:TetR/AcrR family transcriptional regulator n=1 Tax=Curtobacterium flaccumfaciens TaxID=2035 RepID=UPI003EE60DBE